MRFVIPSLVVIAAVGVVPVAVSAQRATVARAGNEQSIRIGRTLVARPFGADLVDRLALVGSYKVAGRRTHLVRGDANGQCPSRFVFVTEAAGGAPILSTPFGTCSGAVRVRAGSGTITVTLPIANDPQAVARFAFDGTVLRPLDATGTQTAAPQCPPAAHVDPALQAATIAAFEKDFPAEYRSRRALKRVTIDPQEMRSVVITLACFAPWPAADRTVPALATPLFTSTHGPAAFAALTAIAEDPSSDANLRASVRSFAAEMAYRVDRRASS